MIFARIALVTSIVKKFAPVRIIIIIIMLQRLWSWFVYDEIKESNENYYLLHTFFYQIIAGHCQSLRVILKNNALALHELKPGTYDLSSPINGKPSWTSESQAIWFILQWNQWAIGPIDSLGTTSRGIRSSQYSKDPQNVVSWDYNDIESGWWSAENDILVECISIGMYNNV